MSHLRNGNSHELLKVVVLTIRDRRAYQAER